MAGEPQALTFLHLAGRPLTYGDHQQRQLQAPVFLLPISHFVFGERIGMRAIVGTLTAIAGVAMLLLM
jgi:hypothetical protein